VTMRCALKRIRVRKRFIVKMNCKARKARDMNRTRASVVLIVTMCLASASAIAEDPLGIYVGAGAGQSDVRNDGRYGPHFDEQHIAWKAIAGIRPTSLVGVELEYIDFGDPKAGPNYSFRLANSDAKAATLFGLGYLPLPVPFLDIYGKLGVARLHSNTTAVVPGLCPPDVFCTSQAVGIYRENEWSTDLAYGAGTQARFSAIAVRAEYERISASGGKPDIFSLGVTWTF
jgi:opacity protein-like surface antigen